MSEAFFQWLEERELARPQLDTDGLIAMAGGPSGLAVVGVDVLVGFCRQGPLASPRIAALIPSWASVLEALIGAGVRTLYFPSDTHPPDSREFESFPPHCLEGSEESELVPELANLPGVRPEQRIAKTSICSLTETALGESLKTSGCRVVYCFGDCTDLCVFQLASGLRSLAIARNLDWRIAVAANQVETYDLPVEEALQVGALPHPADLLHRLSLYQLELQGVEVFRTLTASRSAADSSP